MTAISTALIVAGALLVGGSGLAAARAVPARGARTTTAFVAGGVAGRVASHGRALGGVAVLAFGPTFRYTYTSRAGTYRIGRLAPGRYTVYFADPNYHSAGNWLPQWYKGVHDADNPKATRVLVRAGRTTRGINAVLQPGGEITGTVRSTTGAAVRDVEVLGQVPGGRAYLERFATTGKNGSYALHALFPGRYVVAFLPGFHGTKGNYAPQWWQGSPTKEQATTIVIRGGRIVRSVNARLGPGAAVTGVVRSVNASGAPVPGVCITASSSDGSVVGGASTDINGDYYIQDLGSGPYQVQFDPMCGGTNEFKDQNQSVTLTVGSTTTLNAFLQPGS